MSPYDLVVTVGTDHHRFDRLTDWLEPWVRRNSPLRVLHQHGTSRPLVGADAVRLVPRATLLEAMAHATVVVAQAGPGTISDARGRGHVPIVVPRLAAHDEVVDDHQVAFARHVRARGWVHVVDEPHGLHELLDAVVAGRTSVRTEPVVTDVAATARALEAALARAVAHPEGVRAQRVRTAAGLLLRRLAPRRDAVSR